MLGLTCSFKLDWGSYLISIVKTATKKIETFIISISFFLLRFLCVCITLPYGIRPCMEYCCHVWAGASSCYLEQLDKLQKRICRTVSPSLATSLEHLAHHRNVASLSLFYRYYFGRCSSKLAQLVPLLFLKGGLLVILINCIIFCHHSQMLQRCLCQQFLFSHSQTLEFSAYRILPFDL